MPGTGDKRPFFFFLITMALNRTLAPTLSIRITRSKKEARETFRQGSDSHTLVHVRLFWETY